MGVCKIQLNEFLHFKSVSKITKQAYENWDSAWYPIMCNNKAIGELLVKTLFDDKEAVKAVLHSDANYENLTDE